MIVEIVLPWPDKRLHPNARVHWAVKAKAAKAARMFAWAQVRAAGVSAGGVPKEGMLNVWIDGYPPDKRRRDHDGFLSSMKSALDGIAQALGVDDHRFVPHPCLYDEVRKGGEVRVRISWDGV